MEWLRRIFRGAPDERDVLVEAMQLRLRRDPSIRAIVRIRTGTWGYFGEVEAVQHADRTITWTHRTDERQAMTQVDADAPTIDLAALVARLAREHAPLRRTLPSSDERGRYGTVFFATPELAAWLVCQYPLTTTAPDGSADDDLWRFMWSPRPRARP